MCKSAVDDIDEYLKNHLMHDVSHHNTREKLFIQKTLKNHPSWQQESKTDFITLFACNFSKVTLRPQPEFNERRIFWSKKEFAKITLISV